MISLAQFKFIPICNVKTTCTNQCQFSQNYFLQTLAMPAFSNPLTFNWGWHLMSLCVSTNHFAPSGFSTDKRRSTGLMDSMSLPWLSFLEMQEAHQDWKCHRSLEFVSIFGHLLVQPETTKSSGPVNVRVKSRERWRFIQFKSKTGLAPVDTMWKNPCVWNWKSRQLHVNFTISI